MTCRTPTSATNEKRASRGRCDQTGNLPSCALCPASPTYWRTTDPPSAADPWNGDPAPADLDLTGWIDDRTPYDPAIDGPANLPGLRCTLCGTPTVWISPKGTRCHPSCATNWIRDPAHRPTTPTPPGPAPT